MVMIIMTTHSSFINRLQLAAIYSKVASGKRVYNCIHYSNCVALNHIQFFAPKELIALVYGALVLCSLWKNDVMV